MKQLIFILITINSFFLFSQNSHPSFKITDDVIESIASEYNIDNINEFLKDIDSLLKNNIATLEIIDKNHRLTSKDIPANMINLSDYNLHTRYKTMLFVDYAVDDFINMSNAAKELNIDIFIASTYRSYEFQDQIFTNMKNYHGEEKAATIVAYPGASQHQLGTAVDFGSIKPSYANTEAGKWLYENAWKYGFTLSYPKGMEKETTYMWEPWHYRYIGKEASIITYKYFNNIQHNFLNFWDKYKDLFITNHTN